MDSLQTARTVVTALKDAGVRDVVIAPGSRSAPLVYALAESADPKYLRLHVRVDERSAAFTALGMAMGTGKPTVVLTTSGTAVGNLTPAMMEASHADVPLVALTADRPQRLQGTGANQTTNQQNFFGEFARTSVTISGVDQKKTHAAVVGALALSQGTTQASAGPVHLNARFDDPLVPQRHEARPHPQTITGALPVINLPLEPAYDWDARWDQPGSAAIDSHRFDATTVPETRSVVVAGHGAEAVATEFATALGLPIFAEPSSNARYTRNAVAAYPLLLETGHPLTKYISKVVLFGRPTLTRTVQALLKREDIEVGFYHPKPVGWFEPGREPGEPFTSLGKLAQFAGQGAPGWLAGWQSASSRAQMNLETALASNEDHGGVPGALRTANLVSNMTRGNLMLGSSSVIRDVDAVWRPPLAPQSKVFAHRGLAGIDGSISTAAGIALATGIRTTLLCGDLSFIYDVNGLFIGDLEEQPALDIVVLNDSGGAIFASLEHGDVAQYPGMASTVERFFGTPHTVNIGALCAAHGVEHQKIKDEYQLVAALGDQTPGIRVYEVTSDRALRPTVRQAVVQAVRDSFVS